jgi:hypothetical protein
MSYYNSHTRPRIDYGSYIPGALAVILICFVAWIFVSAIQSNIQENKCRDIALMFNKSNIKYDRIAEQCIGDIRGERHSFEVDKDGTVIIKRKVIKIKYDSGK